MDVSRETFLIATTLQGNGSSENFGLGRVLEGY
jgi:hypothetical protein